MIKQSYCDRIRQDFSWDLIFSKIGLPLPRRGRARCPLHDGDSLNSLSLSDSGLFHCFVCGESGDKIEFIRKLYRCSFREALAFFGLAPGAVPKPDPEALRRARLRRSLDNWVRFQVRCIGREIYELNRTIRLARIKLEKDADDRFGWLALSICYRRLWPLENLHDRFIVSKSTSDKIEMFRLIDGGVNARST